MTVDHERGIVLIHPRKTAGTTVATALGMEARGLDKHRPYYELFDALGPEKWERFIVIATIRNPFDCVASDYHFNRLLYQQGRIDSLRKFCAANDLSDFAIQYPTRAFKTLRNESDALQFTSEGHIDDPSRGTVTVDYWVRQETLEEDLRRIGDETGLPIDGHLPRLNKSKNKGQNVFSPAAREATLSACAGVFETFYPERQTAYLAIQPVLPAPDSFT